ncbi:hypothetical protein Tco_1084185 [Tanacetum coccineum]
MFFPRFTKIIIHHFLTKDKSISWRNKMFMHTARDDSVLGTMRFVSRHTDTQIYGAILPQAMTNQALMDFVAYKTYHAIASGAEPPKPKKVQKKSESAISSEESPLKKKPGKAKKDAATKPKPTKKKAPVKADRGRGLNVLSEVALSEVAQLKEAIKRSKQETHASHASGSGDGTDLESGVLDEQYRKISGTYEGTSIKLVVPDVPTYNSKSKQKSWGDSNEEDDDDDEDNSGNDDGNNDAGDDNDEHAEEEEEEYTDERVHTPSYYELTDEEKIDDEEKLDEEEDDEVTKELYKDVNVNLEEDAHVTLTAVHDTQKTDGATQSSSVSSNFTSKLLNLDNPSLTDTTIASFMDTIVRHEEPSSQTSAQYTVPVTAVPEITSVHNLDQYAQALSSIPAIVDCYIDNKLEEAISKAIQTHNAECREEAQAEKQVYIDLVDTLVKSIIRKEVKTQLPRILPQAVSDYATPVIEKNYRQDSRSNEKKSSSTSKDASHSQHKPSGKSAHAEEPNEVPPILTWFLKKKLERPPTPDPDWNKRQHVDFRPPQTWINQVARAEEPPTSFDELMDTSFDFSAFVLNRLNIKDLTQEILVGPTFELLKGTCKSLPEL